MTIGPAAGDAYGVPGRDTDGIPAGGVYRVLRPWVDPAATEVAMRLERTAGLAGDERQALADGATAALREVVWRHVRRVVLVEMHAARLTGRLGAADADAAWDEWVQTLAAPGGWEKLTEPYPDLAARLRTVVDNRVAAACRLAGRFGRDRRRLAALLDGDPGRLTEVVIDAGVGQQGGQTNAVLRLTGGTVHYRPRPVTAEVALARLLDTVLSDVPEETRIRVPACLPRRDDDGGYGWVAHVPHRYCRDDGERRAFHRGLGHWLAVMRLLGGGDLHAGNVVAHGPVPMLVDCATLFIPRRTPQATGRVAAVGQATELLGRSMLRTPPVPARPPVLAWWDGALNPARCGSHRPGPEPDLHRFGRQVRNGFREASERMRALDEAGTLGEALARVADSPVPVDLRGTGTSEDLIHMLWHPGALFEPEKAVARAAAMLAGRAADRPGTPDAPDLLAAEVALLRDGDVPVFTTVPGRAALAGPRGTSELRGPDLATEAWRAWRGTDRDAEHQVLRTALICGYLNDGYAEPPSARTASPVPAGELDRCRREQAALIVRRLARSAVRGHDGTVTWLVPALDRGRWSVGSTTPGVYDGYAGVAVLLAGYRWEVRHGRADPVPDLDRLLDAVLHSLRTGADGYPSPGAYQGLGGQVWCWLLLARLGAVSSDEALARAQEAAARLPEALATDRAYDLLAGTAGAVVPLLRLGECTGDARWRELAGTAGQRLRDAAVWTDGGATWPNGVTESPTIGVSHGSAGVGWVLARLAAATGDAAAAELADAAFAWVDSYYDPHRGGWLDARPKAGDEPLVSWCHGSAGIGLVAADLHAGDPHRWSDVLRRAAEATWPGGFDLQFTLCHGEAGGWEVLDRAWRAGLGPPGADREAVTARFVGSVAEYGPATGITRETWSPGLLVGSGGVAYQLLRMRQECDLPSILLPDPGA